MRKNFRTDIKALTNDQLLAQIDGMKSRMAGPLLMGAAGRHSDNRSLSMLSYALDLAQKRGLTV